MELVFRARTADISTREVDGALMVLDERTWEYLHLNETGAVLWSHLEQGASRQVLVEALVSEYEVASADAEADVDAFISDITARGLLAV